MISSIIVLVYAIIFPWVIISLAKLPDFNLFIYYIMCILSFLFAGIFMPLLDDAAKKRSLFKVNFYKTKLVTMMWICLAWVMIFHNTALKIENIITPEGWAIAIYNLAILTFLIICVVTTVLAFIAWGLLWLICRYPLSKKHMTK